MSPMTELIAKWRADAAAEQRVSFHADELEALVSSQQERSGSRLQQFYDVTSWLMSVCPTGRLDEGATEPYHDALVALVNLRAEVRNSDEIAHNECWWNRHLKALPVSVSGTPEPGELICECGTGQSSHKDFGCLHWAPAGEK
jgi:hypothetical protein